MAPSGTMLPPFAPMWRAFRDALQGTRGQLGVVLDAVSPDQGVTGGTTLSWPHKVSPGRNRALYVGLAIGAATDSMTATVTFGTQSLVSVGKVHNNNSTGGYVQLFRLTAPNIRQAPITVTMSAAPTSIQAGSASYFNVDQTTPEAVVNTAFGSGTLAAINTASGAGHVALLLVGGGSAFSATPNAPTTKLWVRNQSGATGGGEAAMGQTTGDPSLTQSWTLTGADWWGAIGADLLPSFADDPTYTVDTPIWVGTYDPLGDLTQFSLDTSSYLPSAPTVGTASPAPYSGTYRGAYSIPAGTSVAGAGVNPRCENTWGGPRDFAEGDEFWFRGHVYLDPSFPDPAAGQFTVVFQFKNEDTGSPPLELSVNNDTSPAHWRIDGGFGYQGTPQQWVALDSTANPATHGVWTDWVFRVKFSSDPNIANFSAWLNGALVVDNYKSPTLAGTLYPSQTSYLKVGYYRSEAITAAGTVFHDQWYVGRTAASVGFTAVSTNTGALAAAGVGAATLGGTDTTAAAVAAAGASSATLGGRDTIAPALGGTGASSATLGGAVTDVGALAAAGAGTATLGGVESRTAALVAAGAGAATLAPLQTEPGALAAAGTSSATLAGSTSATTSGALAATGQGAATLGAVDAVGGAVAALGASSATLAGNQVGQGALAALGAAAATLAGADTTTAALAAAGTSSATVNGTRAQVATLTAAGTSSSSLAGVDTATAALAAAGAGTAVLAGADATTAALAGSGSSSATLAGSRTAVAALASTGAGTAALGGTDTVLASLAAAAVGTATLASGGSASGALAAAGAGTAALGVLVTHPATLTAAGAGTAALGGTDAATAALAAAGTSSAALAPTKTNVAALAAAGASSALLGGVRQQLGALAAAGTSSATLAGSTSSTQSGALAGAGSGSATLAGVVAHSAALSAAGTSSAAITPVHITFGALTATGLASATYAGLRTQAAALAALGLAAATLDGTVAGNAGHVWVVSSVGGDPWLATVGDDWWTTHAVGSDTWAATLHDDPWSATAGADPWRHTVTMENA